MKILHIYDGHERVAIGQGSVPYVVFSLAEMTAKLGHEVTVIERAWRGAITYELASGILFRRTKIGFGSNVPLSEPIYSEIRTMAGVTKISLEKLAFSLKTYEIARDMDFDIVHYHLPFASNILATMSKKMRENSVYTAHVGQEKLRFSLSNEIPLPLRLFSPDLRLVKMVKKTILLNDALKRKLISKGIGEAKLEVIPNGIDKQLLKTSHEDVSRVKSKYKLNGFTILFSGSIFRRKGLHVLLDAMKLLNRQKVTALIVGRTDLDDSYLKSLRDFANSNNIHVIFTGLVDYWELCALYSAADIGILPSIEEGDPISLKEMLSVGKPLIGSRVGGIPAQIVDGKNGFTFQSENSAELAEKIMILVEDEKLRQSFGEYSLRHAENFTWEKIARKYEVVYKSMLS